MLLSEVAKLFTYEVYNTSIDIDKKELLNKYLRYGVPFASQMFALKILQNNLFVSKSFLVYMETLNNLFSSSNFQ